jgi:two-component system, cell cycle sensor histidine kinase and response regulator CckA
MSQPLRVLIIEDSEDDTLLLLRELCRGDFEIFSERVETPAALHATLTKQVWDIVLSDYSLPHFSAPAALALVQELGLDLPFLVVSGTIGEQSAVALLKAGAHDFIMKSQLARLVPAVERELREASERHARRKTEFALHESEARYRSLVETSPDAIILADLEGTIIFCNQQTARLYGYEHAEELFGGNAFPLLVPIAPTHNLWQQLLEQGSVRSVEYTLCRRDGTSFPAEVSASLLVDVAGQSTACVGVIRDVTERKRLEAQFLQIQKMEAIGQLAGGVAHDFNNLLTVIIGYAELALEILPPKADLRGDLEGIQKTAVRAASLTRQLLAFARQQHIEPRVLNLNDLVLDIDKLLHRLIGEDIELATRPGADLGLVKIDPGQIEQVLVNLAVNARDAMPQGGKLTIETANVVLDQEYTSQHIDVVAGHYVLLAVSDTGTGMDAEVKRRLFEPFFSTKEPGKGTGLGLATCHGILAQHGGHIWVYSELNHGTTFKVYLPHADETPNTVSLYDELSESTRGGETLLLVEDEPAVRELAGRVLRMQGYIVLEAVDGEAALHIIQQYRGVAPQLLLTDMVMHQLNGSALAARLKDIIPDIKVLFMSGYTGKSSIHHGRLDTGMAFLQKPFSPALLARKVREVLNS